MDQMGRTCISKHEKKSPKKMNNKNDRNNKLRFRLANSLKSNSRARGWGNGEAVATERAIASYLKDWIVHEKDPW